MKQVIVGALDGYAVARLQMMLPHVCTCKQDQERYHHRVQKADRNTAYSECTDAWY